MRKQIDFTITVFEDYLDNGDGVFIGRTSSLRNWHHVFLEVKFDLLLLIKKAYIRQEKIL